MDPFVSEPFPEQTGCTLMAQPGHTGSLVSSLPWWEPPEQHQAKGKAINLPQPHPCPQTELAALGMSLTDPPAGKISPVTALIH